MIYAFLLLIVFAASPSYGQWNNPENQMLTDSMNSFFYYGFKDPIPFSDPKSLKDTEKRSILSDRYHDESEYMLYRDQQRVYYQNLYEHNYRYRYDPNYRFQYLNSLPRVRVVR